MQILIQQVWAGAWSPVSDKLLGDTNPADPQITLPLKSKGEAMAGSLDFILSDTEKKLLKGFKQVSNMNLVILKITLAS